MADARIPHLRKTPRSAQLIVKGKPFLMLSAELHNSSLSSAKFMEDAVWQNMKDTSINTLLGSVTWETIEPEEGKFDFTELDKVILGAREHDMHLVLLWFGSFKNALSTYAPSWVKKDVKRFPRVHVSKAGAVTGTLELVSPFNERAWTADAKAFAALMAHLKEFDEKHSTVLMVQVENETGMIGDSRDRSRVAEALFNDAVPKKLLDGLQTAYKNNRVHPAFQSRFPDLMAQKSGVATWTDAFGAGQKNNVDADEIFMAWAFSHYVDHVAAAGKAVYPLPLYTNVWLNFDDPSALDLQGIPIVVGGGAKVGIYPSGGACPHTMDVWKLNAPSLDFINPDLYVHDYEKTCHDYTHHNQPLFIPEQRRDEKGARRVWLAYGTYQALGYSPFGIDSLIAHESPIRKHFELLDSIKAILLDVQAERPEDVYGFFFDPLDETKVEPTWSRTFPSSNTEVIITRAFVFGKEGPGAGLIIHQGDNKFLAVGWGFNVQFRSTKPKATFTGILHAEEKEVVDKEKGELSTLRILGGDETRSGEFLIMPNEDPDYGGFPIAVTPPCRTMIAQVWAYSLEEDEDDY